MQFFDVDQGSDEWFDLRKGRPTASELGCILTAKTQVLSKSADRYIERLIAEVLSIYHPERVENYTSRAVRWGQQCEAEARRFYAMERDVTVTNGGFCLSDCGRFGASPDGLVGADGVLELKCPEAHTHTRYLLKGGLPNDYKQQVHGQLIVTGRKFGDFLSYSPGLPPLLVRVEPDEFTEKLRKALDEFWEKYQAALARIAPQGEILQPEEAAF